MLTVEQVKAVFDGHEPGRGGYGSEFEYEQDDLGVVVALEADWKPRCERPEILVVALDGVNVTYRDHDQFGDWEEKQQTETVEELADTLAERGDY